MKSKLFVLLLAFLCCRVAAQEKLPALLIVNADGNYVRNSALSASRSVILIYFQPDCDDCRKFTDLLMKDDVIIRRHQIVMITNADLGKMRQFVADFNLKGKKNVIVGTEGWTGTVQRRLNVSRFPTLAGYDQHNILRWRLANQGRVSYLFTQLKQLSSQSK